MRTDAGYANVRCELNTEEHDRPQKNHYVPYEPSLVKGQSEIEERIYR
jgi:hypothetical protein